MPLTRSAMFERASLSVSVIVFIGNRPAAQSSTARSLFCPSQVESLLEDLILHRLAAEQPFQIAYPFFQPAQLGGRHDLIIGADSFAAPFAHQPSPTEHQTRREPMAAGNIADRHAGLHRLGNHRQLQIGRKTAPAGDARDYFNLRERVGHRRMPRLIPRPSGYCRCPVKTGCTSKWLTTTLSPRKISQLGMLQFNLHPT